MSQGDTERQGTDNSGQAGSHMFSPSTPSIQTTSMALSMSGPLVSASADGIRLVNPALRGHVHVFNGLRVRMGISTGKLEKGTSLRSSAIMERSKGEVVGVNVD